MFRVSLTLQKLSASLTSPITGYSVMSDPVFSFWVLTYGPHSFVADEPGGSHGQEIH